MLKGWETVEHNNEISCARNSRLVMGMVSLNA